MNHRIINADVLDGLGQLDDGSVHCCVTSPPYSTHSAEPPPPGSPLHNSAAHTSASNLTPNTPKWDASASKKRCGRPRTGLMR